MSIRPNENSDSAESICNMFSTLKVTSATSMSAAKKAKRVSGLHGCAVCMKMFTNFQEIRSHVRKVHKATSKELKKELDASRLALKEDSEDLVTNTTTSQLLRNEPFWRDSAFFSSKSLAQVLS